MTPEEKQLLAELRELPDFACYPLPARWYKEDPTLVPPKAINTREFIESGYTLQRAVEPKELPAIFIREPQQGGKLVEVPEPEKIEAETICRPFTLDHIPDVLPSLKELPIPE